MYVPMYIERVPNRNSRPAILLREAWREGKTVRKRTVANLTDWPAAKVEAFRRVLRGDTLAASQPVFTVERAVPHGHVEALLGTVRRLGLDALLAAKRCRERDLVLALIVERLLHPCSKLATIRLWSTTTLAEELAVADATEDEVYAAMDWLAARQTRIEGKLAHRHLAEGARVFYDVSSSFYEGRTCPLARFGHDRDGKHGLPIIVYGVLTDAAGRPVAIEVYPGNTGDATTVPEQVETLRARFGLSRVVLVGDRGMLTETQLETLRRFPGVGWISALRGPAIRALVEQGALQLSLFDTTHLAEITAPEYPGERLVACFNPLLAEERSRKRQDLLAATEQAFQAIAREVARRRKTPLTAAEIGGEGRAGAGPFQDGEALRADDRGRRVPVDPPGGGHSPGGRPGWALRDPDQRASCSALGGRHCPDVQKPGAGGKGVPVPEGDRSPGPAHLPSNGAPGAGALLPVPPGLLRGVAPAGIASAAAFRG